MKKLFTLVCGLFITLGMNAITTLSSSFESWGDSKFVLESAYVCVNDYVGTGIANVAIAPVGKVSEIYNLSGQKVGKSYKGIVIKNGKKFVQ